MTSLTSAESMVVIDQENDSFNVIRICRPAVSSYNAYADLRLWIITITIVTFLWIGVWIWWNANRCVCSSEVSNFTIFIT
jgi:hypothetical protein